MAEDRDPLGVYQSRGEDCDAAPTELDSGSDSPSGASPTEDIALPVAQPSLAAQLEEEASPQGCRGGEDPQGATAAALEGASLQRRSPKRARSPSPSGASPTEGIALPLAQPATVRSNGIGALARLYAAQRGERDGNSRSVLLSFRWSAETNGRVRANLATNGADHYTHALQAIRGLSGMSFYIGITEHPVRRWRHHSSRFDFMTVLVEAPGSHVTGPLEVQLLEVLLGRLGCLNVGRGGETPTDGTPHYLYVAARRDGLLRYNSQPRRNRRQGLWDFI